MRFPDFFDHVSAVRVYDPLAALLGAPVDGVIEYHYADAVKLTGHSCPTVAGAYLTGRAALAALYPDGPAGRGQIRVHMPAPEAAGTTGVTAQVLTLLTGAATDNGFKGLGGRFARNGLLNFAPQGDEGDPVVFERIDNDERVDVAFNISSVPMEPGLRDHLMAVMQDRADADQVNEFGAAWQERVRTLLLEHADDPNVVQVVRHEPATAIA